MNHRHSSSTPNYQWCTFRLYSHVPLSLSIISSIQIKLKTCFHFPFPFSHARTSGTPHFFQCQCWFIFTVLLFLKILMNLWNNVDKNLCSNNWWPAFLKCIVVRRRRNLPSLPSPPNPLERPVDDLDPAEQWEPAKQPQRAANVGHHVNGCHGCGPDNAQRGPLRDEHLDGADLLWISVVAGNIRYQTLSVRTLVRELSVRRYSLKSVDHLSHPWFGVGPLSDVQVMLVKHWYLFAVCSISDITINHLPKYYTITAKPFLGRRNFNVVIDIGAVWHAAALLLSVDGLIPGFYSISCI